MVTTGATLALVATMQKQFKDNSLLFSLSWFSPCCRSKSYLYANSLISAMPVSTRSRRMIHCRSPRFWLNGFIPIALKAFQRRTLGSETSIYTRCQLVLRSVFIWKVDVLITPQQKGLLQGDVFLHCGGLQKLKWEPYFRTIKRRVTWFPRTL